jgi:hypothetical protein
VRDAVAIADDILAQEKSERDSGHGKGWGDAGDSGKSTDEGNGAKVSLEVSRYTMQRKEWSEATR